MNSSACGFKSVVASQIPLSSADFAWQNAAVDDFYARSPSAWASLVHQEPVGLDNIEPTEHVSHAPVCSGDHLSLSSQCFSCGHAWHVRGRCSDPLCELTGDMDRRHWHDWWTDVLTGRKQVVRNGMFLSAKMRNPNHLILTVASSTSLAESVHVVRRAWKKLTRLAIFKRGVVTEQNRQRHPVYGGIVVGETTIHQYLDGTFYHYHLHCLVDCYFLPMKELASIWTRLTDGKGCSGGVERRDVPNNAEGVHYATEYLGKPPVFFVHDCFSTDSFDVRDACKRRADLPLSVANSYRNVMLGLRKIFSFGSYYGLTFRVKDTLSCPNCGSEDVVVYHLSFPPLYDYEENSSFFFSSHLKSIDNGVP